MKDFLLDLIFPKKCVSCGKWGEFVCADCFKNIIFKSNQECPSCDAISKKGKYCPRCRPKLQMTGVVSAAYYKDPIVKALLHSFKYEGIFSLAPSLARWLFNTTQKEKLKFDVITYVPLSNKKRGQRGFNQSELLAQEVSKATGKPLLKVLQKIKETKSQVGLPRKERLKNLSGTFKIANINRIQGKKVLIVDDVLTTGATLNECAKELRKAGAREIWGATIAKE